MGKFTRHFKLSTTIYKDHTVMCTVLLPGVLQNGFWLKNYPMITDTEQIGDDMSIDTVQYIQYQWANSDNTLLQIAQDQTSIIFLIASRNNLIFQTVFRTIEEHCNWFQLWILSFIVNYSRRHYTTYKGRIHNTETLLSLSNTIPNI